MNARSTVSRTNIQPRRGFKNRAAAKTVDRHHLSSYPLKAVCRAAAVPACRSVSSRRCIVSIISSALAVAWPPCCAIQ